MSRSGSLRPGPQTDVFFDRLRAWPVSSWRYGDRIANARAVVQRLADLAAAAEGQPSRTVPAVGPAWIADQLQVLTADARRSGADAAQVEPLLADLGVALGFRRG